MVAAMATRTTAAHRCAAPRHYHPCLHLHHLLCPREQLYRHAATRDCGALPMPRVPAAPAVPQRSCLHLLQLMPNAPDSATGMHGQPLPWAAYVVQACCGSCTTPVQVVQSRDTTRCSAGMPPDCRKCPTRKASTATISSGSMEPMPPTLLLLLLAAPPERDALSSCNHR